MSSHRFHPAPERDRLHALLFDECHRCEQIAEAPLTRAHPDLVAALWRRMIAVERDTGESYGSEIESAACRELYVLAVGIERTHPQVDPWCWPWTAKVDSRGNYVHLGPSAAAPVGAT